MIFAKLSGMPIKTQISRVTMPASSSRTDGSSTSPNRRSTTQRMSAINNNA